MTDVERELQAAREHLAALKANGFARDRESIVMEFGFPYLGKIRNEEQLEKHIKRLEQDVCELGDDPDSLPERADIDEGC